MLSTDLPTDIVIVAEIIGFNLMENEHQFTSYAKLDVVQQQCGLSAQATRITQR